MPTNTLTDNACRMAKPSEKPQKLFDGHGLHLYISPKGAKSWRMAYRLNKKPQTATFGPYPLLSLAEARVKRDELRRQLLEGEDPRKEEAPAKQATMTLQQASDAYWGGRQDVSPSYVENATRAINNHLAKLLKTPIKDITRAMLMEELRRMDAAGLYEYVRKVRMWVGQVFEWAIENEECETNPAAAIKADKAFGKKKVVNHAALRLVDVPVLMDRLKLEDELLSVLACQLMALTWVRTGELRFMLWTEIESGGKMWRIPEGKMKRRYEHLVPLSKQAQQILAVLKSRSRGSNYVFPAEHRPDRPMSENTVLYLLYRLGYKGEMTGHGWRSVVSTWANERGFNPDAIERQLAHVPDDKVRAAYNRAAYLPTRRKMLQAWADWLDNPDTSGDEG